MSKGPGAAPCPGLHPDEAPPASCPSSAAQTQLGARVPWAGSSRSDARREWGAASRGP